jgi:hypothetical protein
LTALLADADACGWSVALVLGIFGVLGLMVARMSHRRGKALRAIVAVHGGTIERGDADDGRMENGVRFESQGVPALLTGTLGGEGESSSTRLELMLPGVLKVGVTPRGFFDSASASAEDEQVGDTVFDARFKVSCDPAGSASALFDADARRLLLELHDAGAGVFDKGASLFLGPKGGSVVVPRDLITDRDTIVAFVERSLAIIRRLRAAGG